MKIDVSVRNHQTIRPADFRVEPAIGQVATQMQPRQHRHVDPNACFREVGALACHFMPRVTTACRQREPLDLLDWSAKMHSFAVLLCVLMPGTRRTRVPTVFVHRRPMGVCTMIHAVFVQRQKTFMGVSSV